MSGNLAVSTINGVDISVSPVATQAFATGQDLGVGQTWQDVSASRAVGTTYTNSTGKPIMLEIIVNLAGGHATNLYLNGVIVGAHSYIYSGTISYTHSVIVPNGNTYSVIIGSGAINKWSELR